MKNTILFCLALLSAGTLFAQSPQSVNYQAVLRNASGSIIQSQTVGLRMSILRGSATGTAVYTETHSVNTNDYGVVNLQIGNGSSSDQFSEISWGNNAYYLKVELDENNTGSYKNMGTTQFVSVPYALHAETATKVLNNNDGDRDSTNELQTLSKNGSNISLSENGGTVSVDDADADATNELQGIILSGNNLTLSQNGGTVTIPTHWRELGDTIFYDDFVSIGDHSVSTGSRLTIGATNSSGTNIGLEAIAQNGTSNYGVASYVESSSNTLEDHAALWGLTNTDDGIGYGTYTEVFGDNAGLALGAYANTGSLNFGGEFNAASGSSNTATQRGLVARASGTGTGFHNGIGGSAYGRGVFSVGGTFAASNLGTANTNDVGRAIEALVQDSSTAKFNQGILALALSDGDGTSTSTNQGIYSIARNNSNENIGVAGFTDGAAPRNVGLEGIAEGSVSSGTNYGVYGTASNAGTNYAGYFAGNLAYTGNLSGPSDAKLKNDIQPLNTQFTALDMIDSLKPVAYTYKTGDFPTMQLPSGMQYGFVAQDVQKIFPHLAQQHRAPGRVIGGTELGSDSTSVSASKTEDVEYIGINYVGLIPVLTQGIQEQQTQIDTMQAEIAELKKQNALLLQLLQEQQATEEAE